VIACVHSFVVIGLFITGIVVGMVAIGMVRA
jgi:hypothetical protein